MNLPWLRLYTDARTDNKLRTLSDPQHRVWFSLLCYAADQPERGKIAGVPEFVLAIENAKGDADLLRNTCNALGALQVISCDFSEPSSVQIVFLNFDKRQRSDKPSDSPDRVKERVARSREKKKSASKKAARAAATGDSNAPRNAPVTPCNAPVTPLEEIREEKKEIPPPPPVPGGGVAAVFDDDEPFHADGQPPPVEPEPRVRNDPDEVARVAAAAERLFPTLDYGPKVYQLATTLRADWLEAAMLAAHAAGNSRWKFVLGCYRRIAEDGGPRADPPPRAPAAPLVFHTAPPRPRRAPAPEGTFS